MNLNDLVNLILNNLDNLKIEYSNTNGQESLKINGKEICECKYDDSKLIKKIEEHKNNLNKLDDCTFMDVVEYLKNENVNLLELNKFMDKEHYIKEDECKAKNYINIVNNAVCTIIQNKIENLCKLVKCFK